MASNEGFGLGTCEALMCGTPISVNVTGGLQDQCGFRYKDKLLTYEDYSWVHSLHDEKKWKDNPDLTWGEWVKPVCHLIVVCRVQYQLHIYLMIRPDLKILLMLLKSGMIWVKKKEIGVVC